MIDYYETRSQPITRVMVWQAYQKVKLNKGSSGIDNLDWDTLDRNLSSHLYKLWNRLSSGSYFPKPVKEVAIKKKSGGVRKLGIPTILDRIAQEVVKTRLERIVEPGFMIVHMVIAPRETVIKRLSEQHKMFSHITG